MFDEGYEAYREWVLPRMIKKGILPEGTELTPINPMPNNTIPGPDMVRPWNTLNADEKKLFSRMAEVYAGFSNTQICSWGASWTISSRPGSSTTR